MITLRPLLVAVAAFAALPAAAPAVAQTRDPIANTALAVLDDCLVAARGGAPLDAAMAGRGFKPVNGGWVNRIGDSVIAASITASSLQGGTPVRVCAITLAPLSGDMAGLDANLAARGRAAGLTYFAPGPDNHGGTVSGWANLDGRGLLAITITRSPATGGTPANATVSAIWR